MTKTKISALLIFVVLNFILMNTGFAQSVNRTFGDKTFRPGDGATIYFDSYSHCHLICTVQNTSSDQDAYIAIEADDVRNFSADPSPNYHDDRGVSYYHLKDQSVIPIDMTALGDNDERESSGITFIVPEEISASVKAHCEVAPGDICPDIPNQIRS